MLRSFYSGISGLRTHQVRMDVVANNIANVNTTGFKSARANFQDVLAQTIGRTEINTTQVGLGVTLAAIDNVFTQGALQTTGRVLDLAIEGNGFFVVKDRFGNIHYTRDGTFYIDRDGCLVNAQGFKVQDKSGADIKFDNPGTIVSISVATNGDITATYPGSEASVTGDSVGTGDGNETVFTLDHSPVKPGSQKVYVDGVEQVEGTDYTFDAAAGKITFATAPGVGSSITADYTYLIPPPPPVTKTVGLATFDNVESLQRAGSNLWKITPGLTASGGSTAEPFALKTPGAGGAGTIRSGYLEMSNVDLALEFTTMITTQRGYQANARIITTSDELLQELVNLKR